MKRLLSLAATLGLCASSALPASAAIHGSTINTLIPSVRGIAADVSHPLNVKDLGLLPASTPVTIGLMLKYRNEDQLSNLIAMQSTPGSRYFRQYLTKAQFDQYFAPGAATVASAKQLLQKRGFTITAVTKDGGMLQATAPASTVQSYFGTVLHRVVQLGRGTRYLNTTPAIMPSELKGFTAAISGLHSTVGVSFPMEKISPAARVAKIAEARAQLAAIAAGTSLGVHQPAAAPMPSVVNTIRSAATPAVMSTSTPAPNPHPDPTESPDTPASDMMTYGGYGAPIFAIAYDYPLQHGYGGTGHAVGSVIDTDYADADAKADFADFGIKHTGKQTRVCTDANPMNCYSCMAGTCVLTPDTEGESTLDAEAILGLAPQADFYEYLAPQFDDLGIEWAYERVISDDIVDAVNSSFGGCETDDPNFEYATNYIAMEGVALGITFSASTGDTGGASCGAYATNGAPQTLLNASAPAIDDYFVGVGGTTFQEVTGNATVGAVTGSPYYTNEIGWLTGGGGYSAFEPIPPWQTAAVKAAVPGPSTSYRNIPELSLTADPNTGVALAIVFQGSATAVGGTSLSSPMWTAMQTEINQVQGSRNGFVNPNLYAVFNAEPSFAYRDTIEGNNIGYTCAPGYDDCTGMGSPKGWELAGASPGT